ncbi:MAG TPA: hypothetical protein PKL92_01975 [Aquaticitalea sp.]|nr:hypothetical protein [Aquaticitalea sp.]
MKTRQPKSRLKCIALLLLGLVATIGCQKTELDNTPAQQENFQRFRIEHYTVEDLQRNGKMETELGKLLKLLAKGGQVHAKDGTSPVGTDSIKYVEEYATGKHSYNFPMPADSLGRMRNLAMVSRNGSGYDAHVVVYGFSEEEFLQLDEVELSERGAMFSPVLDLDSLSQDPSGLEKVHAGWMCVEVWGVETLTEHNGDLHGVSHDGTCVVPGCRFGQTVPVLISSDCTLDTGGGTSDGGSWYPNPNGGQGNPHPGPGNGNVTTPASCNGCSYFDPENPGEQCLALAQAAQLVSALGLNSGQAAMIRSNCAFGSQLYNYLNNGGDEAFAIAAINAMPGGEVDWEYELIFEITETLEFQNQTCVKKIKDDLMGIKRLSRIIKKFEPTHPVLNLEWGMFNNSNWYYTGQTSLNEDISTAFININSESVDHVSNIIMATTIAHELIHAELYRKLKELVEEVNVISYSEYEALENNYPGIANYVFAYGNITASTNTIGQLITWGLTPDYSLAHHNQMASFYRGVLKEVMQAYDDLHNIERDNPSEFYEAISWVGLRTYSENGITQYYDAWLNFVDQIDEDESDLPVSERTYNRYINIIQSEMDSNGINCD